MDGRSPDPDRGASTQAERVHASSEVLLSECCCGEGHGFVFMVGCHLGRARGPPPAPLGLSSKEGSFYPLEREPEHKRT